MRLIGKEHFQSASQHPPTEDVKIEEIGEENDEDVVDIDIDPENINEEEIELVKALYLEENYEELDDDFMLKANLDQVLEEYEDDLPEPVPSVPKSELDEALDEFISEHKEMFEKEVEKKVRLDFEKIPFEEDHVLRAAMEREPSPVRNPADSESSEEIDDVVSHTSQYTNTDNRPAVLSVRKQKERKEKKTGDEGKEEEEEEVKGESGKRIRNETKEEKKIRKEKIKADKKTAREKKKTLKEMYKQEKVKLDEKDVGSYDIRQGTSIIKIS